MLLNMEENGVDSHAIQDQENIVEEANDTNGSDNAGEVQTDSVVDDEEVLVKKANGRGRGKAKKTGTENQVKENNGSVRKKRQRKEPTTPLIDRPSRDRKSIERFAASIEREKVKEFKIEKGAGTALKDIPNIVFKLSKRKGQDESVQLLHRLLYGKKVKPHLAKPNILQFSGYVWSANEEKEKTKIKERLEKCVKESLLHISDLLDLNLPKAASKKEDVVMKLLEFLESPHKTTVKLLEETVQKSKLKKRQRTPVKGTKKKAEGDTPRKKQKRESKASKEEVSAEEDEDDEAVDVQEEALEDEAGEELAKKKRPSKGDDDHDTKSKISKRTGRKASKTQMEDEVEDEDEAETKDSDDEDYDTKSKVLKKKGRKSTKKQIEEVEEDEAEANDVMAKSSSKAFRKRAPRAVKSPVQSPTKETKKGDADSSKVFSRKKRRAEEQDEEDLKMNAKPSKEKGSSRTNAKDENKPKLKIKVSFPTDEELRGAICALLQDADFSTVTFTDVVKQLGSKFGVDLSEKKTHVKDLIQEEISKIVDEDDGEEEDDDGIDEDAEKSKEESGPEGAED